MKIFNKKYWIIHKGRKRIISHAYTSSDSNKFPCRRCVFGYLLDFNQFKQRDINLNMLFRIFLLFFSTAWAIGPTCQRLWTVVPLMRWRRSQDLVDEPTCGFGETGGRPSDLIAICCFVPNMNRKHISTCRILIWYKKKQEFQFSTHCRLKILSN